MCKNFNISSYRLFVRKGTSSYKKVSEKKAAHIAEIYSAYVFIHALMEYKQQWRNAIQSACLTARLTSKVQQAYMDGVNGFPCNWNRRNICVLMSVREFHLIGKKHRKLLNTLLDTVLICTWVSYLRKKVNNYIAT